MKIDKLKIKFSNVYKKYISQSSFSLSNINFDIHLGDHVCIIGPNGSGKSTILKLIAGILKPDHGSVLVNDKVTVVLELEGVLHEFLSGYENMIFFSLINKFEKKTIQRNLDQMIEFSELGEKVNDLVFTYSSGMIARMAISPSLTLINPIIIFDEVMSVLDAKFKEKVHETISYLLSNNRICFIQIAQSYKEIPATCNKIFEISRNGELKIKDL